MDEVTELDVRDLPRVLVVDGDPDFRALSELHVRIAPGVELAGAVASLPEAMDAVLLLPPAVVLVGLGRPHAMEGDDLTLLQMLAPTTPLVVASVHGAEDARRRAAGVEATFVDKLQVFDLVEAISDAAATGSGARGRD